MIGCFQINIIRRDISFASPTVVYDIYQFFGNVQAELVFPSVVKPSGKFLSAVAVTKLRIQLALFCQTGIGKITAAHYGLNLIEIVIRAMGEIELCMKWFTEV